MELFSKTVQFRGTRTRILIILEPFVIMVDFALFFLTGPIDYYFQVRIVILWITRGGLEPLII